MRRFILVALMMVTVAGCDRFPDLSIQVSANLLPSAGSCTVAADQAEVLLGGTYDLNFVRDYVVNARVDSYLVANNLDIQGGTQNMLIESLDMTILLPDGTRPEFGDLPNPYRVTTNASIPANATPGSSTPGVAAALGIPASYYDSLVDIVNTTGFTSILLEIRANGTTVGGFSQQSPPFLWPIYFCTGCLGVVCEEPAQLGDPVNDACYPGQDGWQYCGQIVAPAP